MKKTLLTIMGAMLCYSGSMAFTPSHATLSVPSDQLATVAASGSQLRGPIKDVGYELSFAGSLETWAGLDTDESLIYQLYIYVTPEIATQLAGNQLTEITLSCAFTGTVNEHEGTVFVTEDLSSAPVSTQPVTIVNNYQAASLYNTFALDTPYTIKENTGFYYGYTITGCGTDDYPVGIGSSAPNSFAGGVNAFDANGNYVGSLSVSEAFAGNLYLTAKTVGDKRELLNIVDFALKGSNFALPVVHAGENIDQRLSISNLGSNKITYIEYTVDNGNGVLTQGSNICSINAGKTSTIKVNVKDVSEGANQIKLNVTVINDEAKDFATLTNNYIALPAGDEGYQRNFLVEEATGTWCGWCPRGIVALDYMTKTYPETFIGIGVHCSDNLEAESYMPFADKFVSGFPTCVINRDANFVIDPSTSELESAYSKWQAVPGVAKIDINEAALNADCSALAVTTGTTFAFSNNDADYRLAYVVIEDNLAGVQKNYYSGGGYGEMDGWEKKASSVAWRYADTARDIYDCWGIDGSVSSIVTKGVADIHTYEVPLTSVKTIENSSVVVMLLDGESGVVLNAAKIKYADFTSGINDIITDGDASAEYYNLQGMRMQGNTLPAGVYIVRQGDKVAKRIIR